MRGVVKKANSKLGRVRFVCSLAVVASLLLGGCFRGEQVEEFYGRVSVPQAQEFRWSDGGLPRVFDPARAAAPPPDAVRALCEGRTDYEPGSLRPVPAVATRWETPDGGRTWTFHLRPDARWSNGDIEGASSAAGVAGTRGANSAQGTPSLQKNDSPSALEAPSMLASRPACGARSPRRSVRRQERTKSCAVTASPFDQRASGRRWKVHVRPPSGVSQRVATAGTGRSDPGS